MKVETNGEGTLCFLIKNCEVLLARKTRNIGKGTLNGYGGGREDNESLEECCAREVSGECGVRIKPEDLRKFGIVYFHNERSDGGFSVVKVYVFVATKWRGIPKESVEMANPKWYPIWNLPFDKMLPADRYWLAPIFLRGKRIVARAYQNLSEKKLLRPVEIREVADFSEDD